jgi:hypothetical protein
MSAKKEEPKTGSMTECMKMIIDNQLNELEELKQETLEEAFKKWTDKQNAYDKFDVLRFGAKWQAERMYSEEDMKRCWQEATEDMRKQFSTSYSGMTFEKFIEQFKKK